MAIGELSRAIAIAAFVASYVGLGRVPGLRIDRTGVAIIGAAVMVVSGALYCKVGVPLTLVTLLVGVLVLALLPG